MNLNRTLISVFPLSKNRSGDSNSRALTEDRIANIIRQIVDVDGFVISNSVRDSSFQFNLYGYFITVEGLENIYSNGEFDTANEIWANITLDGNNEISGQDDDNTDVYTGVSFNSTATGSHSLKLLEKKTSAQGTTEWVIPELSRYKLVSDTIKLEITRIDGKH